MCSAAASVSRAANAAQTPESMPPLNNTTDRGFFPATAQHPSANEICLSCDGGSGRNSCTMIHKLSQNFTGLAGLVVAVSNQHSAKKPDHRAIEGVFSCSQITRSPDRQITRFPG